MTQTSTGGNLGQVTGNPSAYLTYGGSDLGFTGTDIEVNLAPAFEPLHYGQSKARYGHRTVEGDPASISTILMELIQSRMVNLFPDATSTDSGNSISSDGTFGEIITGAAAWCYFLHNISGLPYRLTFPLADLVASGPMPIGSGADDLQQPIQILAKVDPDGTAGERLWKLWYTENATLLTVTPSPADAATGVSVSATVTLTFDAAVGENFRVTAAVNPYIYLIKTSDGTTALTGITWNAAGTEATLTHANFGASSLYNLIVSGEIRGTTGMKLAGDGATAGTNQIINFTTA